MSSIQAVSTASSEQHELSQSEIELNKKIAEFEAEIEKIEKGDTIQSSKETDDVQQESDIVLKDDDEVLAMLKKEDEVREFKWRPTHLDEEKTEKLLEHVNMKLSEGFGETIFELGVDESGVKVGLSDDEIKESLENLKKVADQLTADISVICEKQVEKQDKKVMDVLIRRRASENYIDIRIAVCGNVDSGKSTLCGVLTSGQLDNGRGKARATVFTHKHELETGRTSSVSHQIFGFDSMGDSITQETVTSTDWKDIVEKSSKVISLTDLAGHEKYLKTTAFGLTGGVIDYAAVIIGSNMGLTKMTKEHIGLCLALKIPIFFVVTKIDICPENVLKETIETIQKILKLPGVKKLPYLVKNDSDVLVCAKNIALDRITPVFLISSVTGENLSLLRKFINLLPMRRNWESLKDKPAEFLIDQTFYVSGVGTVVSGIVYQGVINVNDVLMLGPDSNGQFRPTQIKSMHCKRVNVKRCFAGQHASFALKKEKRSNIRKGMVLVEDKKPQASWEFEAEVVVLYHSTTIKSNYQPVIHTLCVRQASKILSIQNAESLRTGDKAIVRFRFMFRPEFLKVGERLIFREGRTKGIGKITAVL